MSIVLFFLSPSFRRAQDKITLFQELNKEIWVPFVKGVNTNNSSLINGVNSTEFCWVKHDDKNLMMDAQAYADDSHKVLQKRSDEGISTTVEIRFLNRTVSSSFAAEKCIAKYALHQPGKDPRVFYSIMLVTSKKEDGRWKKQLQYTLAEAATAEQFANAEKAEE